MNPPYFLGGVRNSLLINAIYYGHNLGGGGGFIFFITPIWGNDPILINIFQMG